MKVYFNGFWDGFIEKTNPVHCEFFLRLFSLIWNEQVEVGDIETSEILCESIFGESKRSAKQWATTVLFSGESRLLKEPTDHLYSFVLYGQRNNKNRINCPLFVPYFYCNSLLSYLDSLSPRTTVPQNAVLAILSNPAGFMRNKFLEALEQRVPVCYAGGYKNNMGGIFQPPYTTPEFRSFVSQFKCIVTMENSQDDTYITEKICHGFLAQTIPIYWGSPRVKDYFNKERFLHVDTEESIERTISQIETLFKKDDEWLAMVNMPIFSTETLWRTMDSIARDCRALLDSQALFSQTRQLYLLCSADYEPSRFERLQCMLSVNSVNPDRYTFHCPTYKHTITDKLYELHVRTPFKKFFPWCDRKLRRSELSLTLNFRAVLEEIDRNYLDGSFLILESDVVPTENLDQIDSFLKGVNALQQNWDCIHIGYGSDEQFLQTPFQETLTKEGDSIRLSRHLNTRCTDSMLWTKKGIEKMLHYMMATEDYSEPLDHYISRYLETNQHLFSFYWSRPTFFKQLTNYGGEESTIQKDKV
jgi:hypothetical protein